MACNLLSPNHSRTEFLLIGLTKQHCKISYPVHHVTSDTSIWSYLLFVVLVSSLILICLIMSALPVIHYQKQIRSCLDHNTAVTIAAFLIHCRLDLCNSLFLNLLATHLVNSFSMLLLVLSPDHQNSFNLSCLKIPSLAQK
jgi:hypothetical protein